MKHTNIKYVNKKAGFDYFLSDDLEVGICLIGTEVKFIREHGLNLKGTYVKIISGELFLLNLYLGTEIQRPVKLLAHKKQMKKFQKALEQDGSTLILKNVYLNDKGLFKGTLCLGKGKKVYNKREDLKRKDQEIQVKRDLKNY